MSIFDDKAATLLQNASTNYNVPKATAFDPVSIAIIISALVSLVEMFKNCYLNPQEALDISRKPGIFKRSQLKFALWRQLGGGPLANYRGQIEKGVVDLGASLTIDEMQKLYGEVANHKNLILENKVEENS